MLILFAIPATAYVLLQSSTIQNKLSTRLMKMVSEKLNTKFTISSIDISFLYRARLNDVYLQDLSGDTLIYVKRLTAGIRFINPVNKEISIGSIDLDQANVEFVIDSVNGINLNYFIDRLKGKETGKKGGWRVDFNNFKLRNSKFSLRNNQYKPVEYGMNYTDLLASHIHADLRRFKPSKDSLSFYVKSLSLQEKSGFVIQHMETEFSESRNFLSFRDLIIQTPTSDIRGDEISLRFHGFSKFKADSFTSQVKLTVNLHETDINLQDVGYFAPVFKNINEHIGISGRVSGPLNRMRGKDMDIRFGSSSRFAGDVSLEGLPDIRSTFILADITELTTSAGDANQLQVLKDKNVRIAAILNKFGSVTYSGNFTGFINDFVAYGKLQTGLGMIGTDLLFRPDSANLLAFQGKLDARDFNLGSLVDASNTIGNISLTATVDGATLKGKSIKASLRGLVQQFEFRQYKYSNISLSGDLENKNFDGSVKIHDPNIDLEFLGRVNFSDSIPAFDFTANITDANPYALNIVRKDPDFRLSCYLIANARASSINNINGEIKLLNSLFVNKDKQLQIYDLRVVSESNAGNNTLAFRSDFLDADLKGDYELTKSGETLKQFFVSYLPSLLDTSQVAGVPIRNKITLTSVIKNIKPILDFFMPDYHIAENSSLDVTFEPDGQQMNLHFESPFISNKNLRWNGVNVNAESNASLLELEAGCKSFAFSDRLSLDNFTVMANASSDTAGIMLRWNNWEDLQYKGLISAMAKISRHPENNSPLISIDVRPSELVTNDTVWHIQPGNIRIDSTDIRVNNLAIRHLNEYFLINGAISQDPSQVMSVIFNRFNLGHLNGLLASAGYNMGGILNGKATLSSFYTRPLFTSQLHIDSLIMNNEMIGNTKVNSSWDNDRKAVLIDAYALRDNLRTINLKGEYLPADQGKIDFTLNLEKLRMNMFNPYVKTIFTDLRGIASGEAALTGTLAKPVLNGEFSLQKTSFTVNYLRSRYNFSEKVQIENNNIYFKDVHIFDPRGNSAFLNGAIRSKYLKDFVLDLTIRTDNFLSLNTTQADNKQFYGTAFATSLIKITGPPKNLFMDITATTNKNTSVKIPLSNTGELNEYPFITVRSINENEEYLDEEPVYQADLSGIQIRFKLIVTPDAEVQIIIDPVLGEIIKGNGSGSIDMRINTSGDFVMNGDYTIEKGEYLFTLQKYINKRLTIEPGGNIRWDGDPLDATVNITATYATFASLSDLFGTDEEQKLRVEDRVIMSGRLMSPDIKYDINLPDADESVKMRVNSAMSTNEEKTKQFISLLMANRFFLNPELRGQTTGGSSASLYSGAAGVNFSEMISNQLSNMLSQIVNDLDIDLNYRSNREMNSEEVQVALSYQFFNDRLTINGSVDMATNAAKNASDEIVGEFDIDYKLTPNGKLRLKTFNHANNEMLYKEQSTYTQGLGVSYKEDFNTFGELLRRLFGKKEESPEPVSDTSDETSPGS